jgi:hypothetical protein
MRVACIWFFDETPVENIADYFLKLSPQIALRKPRALFIEIGKCSRLYSESTFLARTAVILRRLKLEAHVAVGEDITDSLCFAKYGIFNIHALPLSAVIDFADPFRKDAILQKNLEAIVFSFADLGIKTIGDFLKIPEASLVSRFGALGRFARDRVLMKDPVTWPYYEPEELLVEHSDFTTFESRGDIEPIMFELKGHLDRLFSRLYNRDKRLMELEVKIRCEVFSTVKKPIRIYHFPFFAPQSSTKPTLKIVKERIARDFEKSPLLNPVQALTTTALKTGAFSSGQRNMIDGKDDQLENLNSVHNHLVELLGKENVFHAELTEDRRPERSWIKNFEALHTPLPVPENHRDIIPERPTFLCRAPLRIDITAGFVHIRKKRYKIIHWDQKIEIISGGWFEVAAETLQNTFDRSYSVVTLEGYQKIFVFETSRREFYLHGYYG